MGIRITRNRRRRSDAFAERFAASAWEAPEAPPSMWLPALRPMLPDGAPVGVSLGAFKPQREGEHDFWPGPAFDGEADWGPWEPCQSARPRSRVLTAIAAIFG